MTRGVITPIIAPGAYSGGMTSLTWTKVATGSGTSSGMEFALTGSELIVAWHPGTATADLVLESVDDPYGRPETLSIPFTSGQYKVIGPMKRTGWMQTCGKFYLHGAPNTSTSLIKTAVVKIPGI